MKKTVNDDRRPLEQQDDVDMAASVHLAFGKGMERLYVSLAAYPSHDLDGQYLHVASGDLWVNSHSKSSDAKNAACYRFPPHLTMPRFVDGLREEDRLKNLQMIHATCWFGDRDNRSTAEKNKVRDYMIVDYFRAFFDGL